MALRRTDDGELPGLMSYELDEAGLAVEVIHMESARRSNANLLHAGGGHKRYYGIAKVLFALNFILFHWRPQPPATDADINEQPIHQFIWRGIQRIGSMR